MIKIIKKEQLSDQVFRYRLHAPRIAKRRKAGQFIILRPVQNSERIPLTIVDSDADNGWIEIIFQVVGRTTMILGAFNTGDTILDLAGPLGQPTHIEKFGKCVCIGGGVGVAPLYPIIRSLKEAGNEIVSIIGARNKDLVILEKEIQQQSDRTFVTTDDGSNGRKGFVSDVFKGLTGAGEKFDAAFVIGPVMMMKVTTGLTVAAGIKSYASLNPIMIDGTGMCGGCRVTVFNETKFGCVDGPEFDASGIDWDELIKRLGSYRMFESDERKKHECKIESA
ncbi:MAG: sulfide/dihydroorotate dehydrogenase-like FAD/NAD-binding protein [Chitinispirillaceae bacterium]|nr:sulfide/dihydroorotate dehydrogenase-like FAD/NAD-binding protein [Chitinispirillaceae bacterium]